MKKEDDLSSPTTIKTDVLARSGESGLLQSMAGKTSGLKITSSTGDPGAGAFIVIRGQNSLNGSASPLIIIDGIAVSNNNATIGGTTGGISQQSRLNYINPEDIESISVLKGASAAAVHGTGDANGVIVIKTKRGSKNGKRWSIEYKAGFSADQINVEWDKQNTYGQDFGGIAHLTGSGLSYTGFSYGDKIAERTGVQIP
jgi:TonB-dependent SusC/RagA subfamily outer membrane receptor